VRLLDPPLHEFLPDLDELQVECAVAADAARPTRERQAARRGQRLHEQNPMLGLRGVRLGLPFPGLFRCRCARSPRPPRTRAAPAPGFMVPLVGAGEELRSA
jgi:pyruvate,orthophosphate dikinase